MPKLDIVKRPRLPATGEKVMKLPPYPKWWRYCMTQYEWEKMSEKDRRDAYWSDIFVTLAMLGAVGLLGWLLS